MRICKPKAVDAVLLLLCAMYFLLYVDRVNISTAAMSMRATPAQAEPLKPLLK